METQYHEWIKGEPNIKVKLERGQKGTYAWEITYEGEDRVKVINKIASCDAKLKSIFAKEETNV